MLAMKTQRHEMARGILTQIRYAYQEITDHEGTRTVQTIGTLFDEICPVFQESWDIGDGHE